MAYPFDAAGDPADAPTEVSARLLGMAQRADDRAEPAGPAPAPVGAPPWRRAYALDVLLAEANAAAPGRSTRSDGTIGDAAHQARGDDSDHNPWLIHGGRGIVRAADLTNDPALKLAAAFERLRVAAYTGRLPQVMVGGYAILNGRITAPDWSGWRAYKGNPHVLAGHVSLSLTPAQFDSKARWGIFADPAPPGPIDHRWLEAGPGHYPPSDPRHAATMRLQRRLRTREPVAARGLVVDGLFGEQTRRVVLTFQRKRGLNGDGVAGPLTLYRLGL